MKETDAYEQAYKNGYEAGKRNAESNIVHCKDCKHNKENENYRFCEINQRMISRFDYCSHGEKGEEI